MGPCKISAALLGVSFKGFAHVLDCSFIVAIAKGRYTKPMEILFTQLSPVEMTLMASGILCAAAMRAFTGFGFALMAVPLLSLFLLPTDAVVLVALLDVDDKLW